MNERSIDTPRPGVWHLEDFRVGQRWRTGERLVTTPDVQAFSELSGDVHPLHVDAEYAATTRFGTPVAPGPMGIAITMGLLHGLHLIDDTVVALTETRWRYLAPLRAGDRVHVDLLVTGVRRSRAGATGVVERDVRLRTTDGTVLQEGVLPVLVRARSADGGTDDASRAFGTVAWGELLAARLSACADFTSAVATWDGSLGLRCGEREMALRIYRGRVLEAVRRTPHGATFTLDASARTWTELATGPRNDAIRRASAGQLTTTGDAYEYLRLTKAVSLLWDEVRALAGKEFTGGEPSC